MIARLSSPHLGTAELDEQGVWHAADPMLQNHLNWAYSPKDYDPSMGSFGWQHASTAAAELGMGLQMLQSPDNSTDAGVIH